jgi:hypothetical protein
MKLKVILFFLIILIPVATKSTGASHSIAPSYTYTHINTAGGDRYNFHSAGFNYTVHGKKKYAFFSSVTIMMRAWASQNGSSFDNRDFYVSVLGSDLLFGVALVKPTARKIDLTPAVGGHLNGIRLRGGELYKDFYSLTAGVGVSMHASFRLGGKLYGLIFTSGGLDFVDLLYDENKLKSGYSFSTGVGLKF